MSDLAGSSSLSREAKLFDLFQKNADVLVNPSPSANLDVALNIILASSNNLKDSQTAEIKKIKEERFKLFLKNSQDLIRISLDPKRGFAGEQQQKFVTIFKNVSSIQKKFFEGTMLDSQQKSGISSVSTETVKKFLENISLEELLNDKTILPDHRKAYVNKLINNEWKDLKAHEQTDLIIFLEEMEHVCMYREYMRLKQQVLLKFFKTQENLYKSGVVFKNSLGFALFLDGTKEDAFYCVYAKKMQEKQIVLDAERNWSSLTINEKRALNIIKGYICNSYQYAVQTQHTPDMLRKLAEISLHYPRLAKTIDQALILLEYDMLCCATAKYCFLINQEIETYKNFKFNKWLIDNLNVLFDFVKDQNEVDSQLQKDGSDRNLNKYTVEYINKVLENISSPKKFISDLYGQISKVYQYIPDPLKAHLTSPDLIQMMVESEEREFPTFFEKKGFEVLKEEIRQSINEEVVQLKQAELISPSSEKAPAHPTEVGPLPLNSVLNPTPSLVKFEPPEFPFSDAEGLFEDYSEEKMRVYWEAFKEAKKIVKKPAPTELGKAADAFHIYSAIEDRKESGYNVFKHFLKKRDRQAKRLYVSRLHDYLTYDIGKTRPLKGTENPVWELKIHQYGGYRFYFAKIGTETILVQQGEKTTQARGEKSDIKKADEKVSAILKNPAKFKKETIEISRLRGKIGLD